MYGGPSPSPNFPQSVRVVTGDNEVVVQNKNLFVGYSNMSVGFLPQSGSYPTTNPSFPLAKYQLIELKQGESVTLSNSTSGNGRVRYIDKETNLVVGTVNQGTNEYYTSTTQFGDSFHEGTITANKDIILGILLTQTDISPLMIEYGTTATSYVAHQEQSYTLHLGSEYLAGIGDYDDTIEGTKDNWKIKRNVGKITFNGSENWGEGTWGQKSYAVRINEIGLSGIIKAWSTLYSQYFKGSSATSLTPLHNEMVVGSLDFVIQNEETNTTYDFKSWLSTHNTEVYYQRQILIEETITDTTLISDLNNIYDNARSYAGQTNISTTYASGNAQMSINITALKQLS